MAPADGGGMAERLVKHGDDSLGDDGAAEGRETRVYLKRWWILALYAWFSLAQGWLWAIPGPLSSLYVNIYGPSVTTYTTQLLLAYGPIFFLATSLPFGYWMDLHGGIKQSLILSSVLVTAGAVLRCLASDNGTASVVMLHVSYALNDIAGPVAMAAVSKLSEDWFPPH